MLSIETGAVAHSVPIEPQEEDTDDILTFTVGSDSDSLVTAHRSGLLKLWDWRSEFIFYLYLLFPRMYFEMGERRQKTSLVFFFLKNCQTLIEILKKKEKKTYIHQTRSCLTP